MNNIYDTQKLMLYEFDAYCAGGEEINMDTINELTDEVDYDDTETVELKVADGIAMASGFTNSPLISYRQISPNKTPDRTSAIKKITLHMTAGVLSIESLGGWFSRSTTNASSNYGVGTDGRRAMYVEEKDRAWTSSNTANDNQAITIEIVNSATGGNWPISQKAYDSTIELVTDICKRNGITKLIYNGTVSGNVTRHDMFKNKVCPGPYIASRLPQIAEEINRRLTTPPPIQPHWGEEFMNKLHTAKFITDRTFWSAYDHYVQRSYIVTLIDNVTGGPVTDRPLANNSHWASSRANSLYRKRIIESPALWNQRALDEHMTKDLLMALIDKATGGTLPELSNKPNDDHWARTNLESLIAKKIIITPSEWVGWSQPTTIALAMAIIWKAFGK